MLILSSQKFLKCNGRVHLLTTNFKTVKKNLYLTHAYSEKKEHSVLAGFAFQKRNWNK